MTSSRACDDSGSEKSMPRISAPSAGDNLREIMRIPVVTMFERDALRSESECGVIFDIRSKIGFLIELTALKKYRPEYMLSSYQLSQVFIGNRRGIENGREEWMPETV
ncbi:hypothetical protein [Burkholderia pseudomallei]|uniref:hypothetical protein n=1 Tax=Burkholderia pseudomallei TaxID=28450 RepID=UPI0021806FED|nr:hypothetical protein [Burkholderia pseudomallei]